MDKITELYLTVINTIACYALLTAPMSTKIMFDFGFSYPMSLVIACSILSIYLGFKVTKWEKSVINKRNLNS
jgi:hypothetical protein